jgi:ABC-type multidrug transport system ATPase subunit
MGRRIPELLEQVGLLRARHQLAGTFSRGMQQRLTMARVLLTDPTLVILDEPYAGLDPEGSRTFTELVRALKADHRAVLLVSHEIDDCLPAVDRIAVLFGGKIAWQGPAAGLDAAAVKRTYFEVTGGPS